MNKDFRSRIKENIFTYISALVIIGAFIVVAMVSFLSELGMHPDEFDVKMCMDWCMNRFIWPDMRLTGEGLGDTFSGYGYTKVCNYSPYFLIFSKIAYVFKQFMDVLPYYRMPNLLLMAVICVYTLKKLKDHNYLMLGFGMCIQAWYIFSYVTADAEDFLLGFFAIALLADEDSFLWRTLGVRHHYKNVTEVNNSVTVPITVSGIISCVLLGVMYGLMLLGKPYYYATLMLTFIVLAWRLIKSEINIRKQLLSRYILIAGVAFAILAGRAALDFHYYGFDKASAEQQMSEQYSDYDKNPLTPIEEQEPTYHMASKGYSIVDFFRYSPDWFELSFRSFASYSVYRDGHDLYYRVMAGLYLLIYVWLGVYLCNKGEKGIFIVVTLLNIGSVVASVLNSYLIDCQPQGRYLLPIALATCYLGARARKLMDHRGFRALVLITACLSISYFGLFASRKLIDLGYVRTLFSL
ncbi:hypothetical protein SAMN02910292_00764 [Lachnospiraceae bacterium XBB2008]|nr:hypothetical protein SAMN02910292_00764 [Lachnospiraceae bacterium XBB2008]